VPLVGEGKCRGREVVEGGKGQEGERNLEEGGGATLAHLKRRQEVEGTGSRRDRRS